MDNIIKSDSQNQSLNQFLFVSDSQLIIDVLFNSPFYGAYISYYKYPGFYRNDIASDFLFAKGIGLEKDKYENIERILHDFSINESRIIPDLILLLNTCRHYFEINSDITDQEPIKTDNFTALREVFTLRKFIEGYDEESNKGNVGIDFRISSNEFTITDEAIISDIVSCLKDISTLPDYQNIFKFNYLEEDENIYNKYTEIFPLESRFEINLIKLWTIKRSVYILSEYMELKTIREFFPGEQPADTAISELTGRLMATIGFMPSETEFSQNKSLSLSNKSYSAFLAEAVKFFKNANPNQTSPD